MYTVFTFAFVFVLHLFLEGPFKNAFLFLMGLKKIFICILQMSDSAANIEMIYLLYHFSSSASKAWKLYRNNILKDEDLDLLDEREQISSKLEEVHVHILEHTNKMDWNSVRANKVLNEVQELEKRIFKYQEATGTRARLNLQNKMSLELDAFRSGN